jgi:hypothetical protein
VISLLGQRDTVSEIHSLSMPEPYSGLSTGHFSCQAIARRHGKLPDAAEATVAWPCEDAVNMLKLALN